MRLDGYDCSLGQLNQLKSQMMHENYTQLSHWHGLNAASFMINWRRCPLVRNMLIAFQSNYRFLSSFTKQLTVLYGIITDYTLFFLLQNLLFLNWTGISLSISKHSIRPITSITQNGSLHRTFPIHLNDNCLSFLCFISLKRFLLGKMVISIVE